MQKVQRWYKGFYYKGNPKELVKQISKQVQDNNLGKFIPLLRVEKGAKPRKQFYFFLAVEGRQNGEMPTEVQSTLLNLSFFQYPIKGSPAFNYEEIKPMVGVAHDIYDYTNPIPYQPVQEIGYDNPFDLINLPSINYLSPDIEFFSHRYEQLLYWLSALGGGTWESFKKACVALKLEEPKRILRRLKLLGHIESSSDGSRWSVAPTALVKVRPESNSQEYILCGQRSLSLINELKKYAQVDVRKQPIGEAPPCICVRTNNPEQIFELIKQIGTQFAIANVGEISLQLANILPDLVTWKHNLRNLPGIVPSLYEWQYFDCNVNDFISCISPIETGMYRMQSQKTGYKYTIFYDKESDRFLQGDWYGLRYLALQHNNQDCIARYDRATKRLAIPLSQRCPEIYERALVLASGLLPTYKEPCLIYENVALELANLLSDKLNFKCSEAPTCA
ncbi:MAG TPA: hypothetical protein V6D15_18360 [Oculatellaceae cyanobacterium]|jgi:hypothetical protein